MTGMRIGIDGYNIALPNGTGVATYGHTLTRTLADHGYGTDGVFGIDVGTDPQLAAVRFFETLGKPPPERTIEQRRRDKARLRRRALLPFYSPKAIDVPVTGQVDVRPLADMFPPFGRIVTSPRLFDLAHRHFHYYGRLLPLRMAHPPSVMHWTYPVPVRISGTRNIYTLHDLVPLRMPYTTLDNKQSYRRLLDRIVAAADHIVTVSEGSRRDIVELLGVAEERVTNTWQASSMPADMLARDPAEDAAAVRNILGLASGSYFIFFGAIEPKKNLGRLLEAFLSLESRTPLVIVGGRGWGNEQEVHLLDHAPGAGTVEAEDGHRRVIRLQHLSRSLLLRLIRSAKAAVFPSISEGFGLPVLEAMQLGTPVLTSSISALAEVAGDAAVTVDPYDPQDIAAALLRLDGDAHLREALTQAGPARAAFFSTDRYAERLQSMYEAIVAGR